MARLTAPNGSVVNVSDDYAERLVAELGYEPADEKPKSTARKASSSSKSSK